MPIPVQLSKPEFVAFIFPYLSMPKWGPKCKLNYHRVFNLILWVLYTEMPWKCLPVPNAGDGSAVIHYTTINKVFAKWSDDGSLDQAFIVSVRHLAEQNHLDLSILHGSEYQRPASAVPKDLEQLIRILVLLRAREAVPHCFKQQRFSLFFRDRDGNGIEPQKVGDV